MENGTNNATTSSIFDKARPYIVKQMSKEEAINKIVTAVKTETLPERVTNYPDLILRTEDKILIEKETVLIILGLNSRSVFDRKMLCDSPFYFHEEKCDYNRTHYFIFEATLFE